MNVERREITSSSDPTDDHPWYELSVDEETGTLRIVDESDGGLTATISNGEETIGSGSDLSPDGDRIWALTEEGELLSYSPSATEVPPLRAHLAWYHESTDTLEVLEFVEP
ncbi:hypothetical protein [Halostagnicola sp. A-GB9-2]|uniref:hypothetical protein n=1 Tax=Halostagnicola sp. A-GB9-2 TaxID=3048066 RepID=UPI0024C030BD|nr:hypothetical protein [Halostagnicola sp. A-GB9-2]MDJ1434163.1 hypothetical protein [Halostagnicola sp. A-GB9-2]